MNSFFIAIILLPIIEIYLFIKIGSEIGAITTIFLILMTAVVGVYYAKYEGINTIKSGFHQLSKNKSPTYEVISGAAIGLGAIFLIIPGFFTDIVGFIIIFPLTRKLILSSFKKNFTSHKNKKNDFTEGEFEDIDNDDDRKL